MVFYRKPLISLVHIGSNPAPVFLELSLEIIVNTAAKGFTLSGTKI